MMCTHAVGLATFFEVTRFKQQIPIFHFDPNVLARVSITPLEDQSIFIFIETSLTIEVITIEHMQNLTYLALFNYPCRLFRHLRRRLLRQILLWNRQRTRRMLLLANHLLNHCPFFFRQTMSLS